MNYSQLLPLLYDVSHPGEDVFYNEMVEIVRAANKWMIDPDVFVPITKTNWRLMVPACREAIRNDDVKRFIEIVRNASAMRGDQFKIYVNGDRRSDVPVIAHRDTFLLQVDRTQLNNIVKRTGKEYRFVMYEAEGIPLAA